MNTLTKKGLNKILIATLLMIMGALAFITMTKNDDMIGGENVYAAAGDTTVVLEASDYSKIDINMVISDSNMIDYTNLANDGTNGFHIQYIDISADRTVDVTDSTKWSNAVKDTHYVWSNFIDPGTVKTIDLKLKAIANKEILYRVQVTDLAMNNMDEFYVVDQLAPKLDISQFIYPGPNHVPSAAELIDPANYRPINNAITAGNQQIYDTTIGDTSNMPFNTAITEGYLKEIKYQVTPKGGPAKPQQTFTTVSELETAFKGLGANEKGSITIFTSDMAGNEERFNLFYDNLGATINTLTTTENRTIIGPSTSSVKIEASPGELFKYVVLNSKLDIDSVNNSPGTEVGYIEIPYTSFTEASEDNSGIKTFDVYVVDAYGNKSINDVDTQRGEKAYFMLDTTVPNITKVEIFSDNETNGTTNINLARGGDTVTVKYNAPEQLFNQKVVILGRTATCTETAPTTDGGIYTYTCTTPVATTDTDGLATFSIYYEDEHGNANTVTTTDTEKPNTVTIDNTKPDVTTADFTTNSDATVASATEFLYYKIGNGDWVSITTSATSHAIPIGSLIEGENIVYLMDAAGNISSKPIKITKDTTAPEFDNIHIESNNVSSSSFAVAGNEITITITLSEAVTSTPTFTFMVGATDRTAGATITGSGTTWTIKYTVVADDQGLVSFTVTAKDAIGNEVTANDTTDNTSVTVDKTAPTIDTTASGNVKISSDNTNTGYATVGDTITLTFIVSEELSEATVTIAGSPATVDLTSGTYDETSGKWTYTATLVVSSEADGTVAISINGKDLAGNALTEVTTITDGSVTIDKTAPVITFGGSVTSDTYNAELGTTALDEAGWKALVTTATDTVDGDVANTLTVDFSTVNFNALGTYTVTYTATDKTGNVATKELTVVVGDTTAPVLSVNETINSTGTFTLTADEEFVKYSIDGGTTWQNLSSARADHTITGLAPGQYTIKVQDAIGNISNAVIVVVNTDGELILTVNETTNNTGNFTLTGNSNFTEYSIDGGSSWQQVEPAALTTNITALAVGTHTVQIKDAAGNISNSITLTVDKTAPTIDTTTGGNVKIESNNLNTGYATVGDKITLTFIVSEELSEATVTIAGSPATIDLTSGVNTDGKWTYTATLIVPSETTEGPVAISINGKDLAGNALTEVTKITDGSVTIDTTAPVLTFVESITNDTYNVELGTAALDEAGWKALLATAIDDVDGNIIDELAVDFAGVNFNAVGTYTVAYAVPDKTGNLGTKRLTVIVGDTTAPVLSVNETINNTGTFTLTADGDFVAYMIEGGAWVDVTSRSEHTLTGLAEGQYTIKVKDALGNESNTVIVVVNTAGELTLSVNETANSTGNFTLTGNSKFTEYSIDGGTTWQPVDPAALTTNITGLAEGTHNIVIRDAAKNVSNTETVTVDKTAPTIDTTAGNGNVVISSSNTTNSAYATVGDTITLTFKLAEELSEATVTIAGSPATVDLASGEYADGKWTYTATLVVSSEADGTVAISINGKDLAGNALTEVTTITDGSVIIDKTGPTISGVSISSTNTTNTVATTDDEIKLTFNGYETLSNLVVKIAGKVIPELNVTSEVVADATKYTATLTVTDEPEGLVTFEIYAEDFLGNSTTVTAVNDSSSVTIDTSSVAFESVTINSDNSFNGLYAKAGDKVELTFVLSEDLSENPQFTLLIGGTTVTSGFTLVKDETNTKKYTISYIVKSTDNSGLITFSITAKDSAGNEVVATSTTDDSSVTVDTTKPVISSNELINSTGAFTITSSAGTFNAYTLDNGTTWVDVSDTESTNIINLPQGAHTIMVRDIAGNTSNTINLIVDESGQLLLTSEETMNNTGTFTFRTNLPVTLVEQSTDGGTTWTTSTTEPANISSGVTHFILSGLTNTATLVRATNAQGVVSNVVEVKYDNTAPTIDTTAGNGNVVISSNNTVVPVNTLAKYGDTITLTVTSPEQLQDVAITIAGTNAMVDAGTETNGKWVYVATIEVMNENDGLVGITINAKDMFGNALAEITTITNGSVTIDKTAPVITFDSTKVTNDTLHVEYGQTAYSLDEWKALVTSVIDSRGNADASSTLSVVFGSVDYNTVGDYTVTYTANDSLGNVVTKNLTVRVEDTTAPTITANEYINETGSFTITSSTGKFVKYSIDGGATWNDVAETDSYNLIGLTGTNRVIVEDATGNRSNVITLIQDNSGELIFTVVGGNINNTGTFSFETNVAITEIWTSTDNSTWTQVTTPDASAGLTEFTLDGLTAALTYVKVNITSNPTAEQTATLEVSYDNTVPTIKDETVGISSDNSTSSKLAKNGDHITLTFTSSEELKNIQILIAGEHILPSNIVYVVTPGGVNYSATFEVSNHPDGLVNFTIDATDLAGNPITQITSTTNTTNDSVVIDNTAPVITFDEAKVTDGLLVVEYGTAAYTEQQWKDIATSVVDARGTTDVKSSLVVDFASVNFNALGEYTVTYTAKDSLENTVTESILVRVIDTTAPTVTSVTINSNHTTPTLAQTGNVVTIEVVFGEELPSTPNVVLQINGNAVTPTITQDTTDTKKYTITYTIAEGDEDGLVSFSITGKDSSNNTVTVTQADAAQTVTVDNTSVSYESITIATDSTEHIGFAVAGEKIIITFILGEDAIGTPEFTMLINGSAPVGTDANAPKLIQDTTNTKKYTIEYTVAETEQDGLVTFSITTKDAAGNENVATETTDGTTVTVDNTIPVISEVTIVSNNHNSTWATVNDIITVTFISNEELLNINATIAGITATTELQGTDGTSYTYTAKVTVAADTTEGVVVFNIAAKGLAGNAITPITATTDSSSVTIDRTAPTISSVSIKSDGFDASFAKEGSVISLTFISSEELSAATVTIAGKDIPVGDIAHDSATHTYTATLTVTNEEEGPVTFTINGSGHAGNSFDQITATTDSTSVTIDKTTPEVVSVSIATNNPSTYFAKVGDEITLTIEANEKLYNTVATLLTSDEATVTETENADGTFTYTVKITVTDTHLEGMVDLSFSATDSAGNTYGTIYNTTDYTFVVVDRTAPVIEANETINSVGSFTITSTAGSFTEYSVDGGTTWIAVTEREETNIIGLAEGQHTIQVKDAAGSVSNKLILTVNTTGELTLEVNETLNNTGTFIFNVNSAINKIETSTNGTDWTVVTDPDVSAGATEFTLTGLTNANTHVRATDAAGNVSNIIIVNYDNTAPVIDVTPETGNTTVTIASNNTNTALAVTGDVITLTVTTISDVTSLTVTLAGTEATVTSSEIADGKITYTATITVTNEAEGTVSILANAMDAAGNTTPITATTDSSSVTIDNTAPGIIVDPTDPNANTTVTIASDNTNTALAVTGDVITLTVTTISDVTSLTVTLAGTEATVTSSEIADGKITYTATITVADEADGTVSIVANAMDAAGNTYAITETTDSSSVTIDNTAPEIIVDPSDPNVNTTVTIASDNTNTSFAVTGDVITLTVTTITDVTSLTVTLAGTEATVTSKDNGDGTVTYTATITVADEADGIVTIVANAMDAAGNTYAITETTDDTFVAIDNVAPVISANENINTTGAFKITSTEEFTSYSIDGGTTWIDVTERLETNIIGLAVGYHNVVVKNAYGAISNELTLTVEELLSAPFEITVDTLINNTGEFTVTANSNFVAYSTDGGTTWIDVAETLETVITGLAEGTYQLQVKNSTAKLSNILTVTVDNTKPGVIVDPANPDANTTVTIASNNTNTAFAVTGDVITLTVTTIEDVKDLTAMLAGTTAEVSKTDNGDGTVTFTATITVADEAEGVVTILANALDAAGNAVEITATTDNSSVTIDNTKPGVIVDPANPDANTTVTIASNNANSAVAIAGDEITLTITTISDVEDLTAMLAGTTAEVSKTDNGDGTVTFTATIIVTNEAEGVVAIVANVLDAAGNALEITATTDNSSVTIDNSNIEIIVNPNDLPIVFEINSDTPDWTKYFVVMFGTESIEVTAEMITTNVDLTTEGEYKVSITLENGKSTSIEITVVTELDDEDGEGFIKDLVDKLDDENVQNVSIVILLLLTIIAVLAIAKKIFTVKA